MTLDAQAWKKKRRRLWLAIALLLVLLAIVFMPPLVSMNRYKSRITALLSDSFGRPVRLSSVEMRLLPLPGFVLTDLTVDEDPAYGAEPVLHANTVTASIRLLSLLKGRVQIGTVSVDEASLNVVRTADGKWNLDPLFRTAAARTAAPAPPGSHAGQPPTPLPYLEATNSRINFKRGVEKLPFSLVETDLSFWQQQPGDWRIRLRGQPARTDVNLDLADTGIVRLEARAQRAAGTGQLPLRQMPLHVDVAWSEAQLGQLARLALGSDPGWRGDLTGEMHLDGTGESAQINTRLRATGVHRAEFAPAAPMDFDASCAATYHYPGGALDALLCDSPLGDGRIKLTGAVPAATPAGPSLPHLTVELDKIPVAAGLDALRTVRSGIGADLVASGTVSGKITYAPQLAVPQPPDAPQPALRLPQGPSPLATGQTANPHPALATRRKPTGTRGNAPAKPHAPPPSPLTGSLIVDGFALSGDSLSAPIVASKLVLTPTAIAAPAALVAPGPAPGPASGPAPGPATANASIVTRAGLEATMVLPAGGATPLAVSARLGRSGYQLAIHGPASVARARELAKVAGLPDVAALSALSGDTAAIDLDAAGPWLPSSAPAPGGPAIPSTPGPNVLTGTVTLRNAVWKADYLANPLELSQATLHLGQGGLLWDPVVFSYGPVKGTATLTVPALNQPACDPGPACSPAPQPSFQLQFTQLDAATLQSALLGAHEPGTLLSTLIDRLSPAGKSTPAWPRLQGTIKAEAFLLGPITLTAATAAVRLGPDGAQITALDAGLLGGQVHGAGSVNLGQAKPSYTFTGNAQNLKPALVGKLAGLDLSGRSLDAAGKLQLSGFTQQDLPGSAQGSFHFDVERGGLTASPSTVSVPAALTRFDTWSGDAAIASGVITLKNTATRRGNRSRPLDATITLTAAPRLTFPAPTAVPAITP